MLQSGEATSVEESEEGLQADVLKKEDGIMEKKPDSAAMEEE